MIASRLPTKLTDVASSIRKNRSAMRTCVAYELPWSQRFFLPLRGSGSLILCREKSRKSSVTGVLNSPFFTYHWNPVDCPVDYYTISTSLNFKENCWGSLTNCRGVTCDGLASRPGGVETLLAASCYRNGDKLRLLWASRLQLRLHFLIVGGQDRSQLSEPISSLERISRFRILQIRTGPSWSKMEER